MKSKPIVISETATLTVNGNKKPYQTPKLQSYGQVHSLTQGPVSGPAIDGNSGMTMP